MGMVGVCGGGGEGEVPGGTRCRIATSAQLGRTRLKRGGKAGDGKPELDRRGWESCRQSSRNRAGSC